MTYRVNDTSYNNYNPVIDISYELFPCLITDLNLAAKKGIYQTNIHAMRS